MARDRMFGAWTGRLGRADEASSMLVSIGDGSAA
jgi:hypothetical protein